MKRRVISKTAEVIASIVEEMRVFHLILTRPAEYRRVYLKGQLSRAAWDELRKKKENARAVQELRRRKLLTDRRQGGQVMIKLSRDAVALELRRRMVGAKRRLPNDEYCLVLFDIPVGANAARGFWRRVLFECGFRREQLSAWMTDKDVVAEMKALVQLLGAEHWVSVFHVKTPRKKHDIQ